MASRPTPKLRNVARTFGALPRCADTEPVRLSAITTASAVTGTATSSGAARMAISGITAPSTKDSIEANAACQGLVSSSGSMPSWYRACAASESRSLNCTATLRASSRSIPCSCTRSVSSSIPRCGSSSSSACLSASSARSESRWLDTETYSPTAMDIAPAMIPATPAVSSATSSMVAPATPTTMPAVDTIPSFAPNTPARSQFSRLASRPLSFSAANSCPAISTDNSIPLSRNAGNRKLPDAVAVPEKPAAPRSALTHSRSKFLAQCCAAPPVFNSVPEGCERLRRTFLRPRNTDYKQGQPGLKNVCQAFSYFSKASRNTIANGLNTRSYCRTQQLPDEMTKNHRPGAFGLREHTAHPATASAPVPGPLAEKTEHRCAQLPDQRPRLVLHGNSVTASHLVHLAAEPPSPAPPHVGRKAPARALSRQLSASEARMRSEQPTPLGIGARWCPLCCWQMRRKKPSQRSSASEEPPTVAAPAANGGKS